MTEEEKDLMTMALDALVDWNHSFNPGEEADKDLIAALEKCLENDAVDSEPVVWMYQNKSTHEVRFQKHMRSFVDHSAWYEIPMYSEPLANQEKTSGSPIKEALAQPEQQWTDETAKVPNHVWDEKCVIGHCGWPSGCADSERCRADNTPAQQQKPVATDWERIARVQDAKLRAMCNEAGGFEKLCEVMDKYERTTPPQRTWVGLTLKDMPDKYMGNKTFIAGAKWAAKQLKANNYG